MADDIFMGTFPVINERVLRRGSNRVLSIVASPARMSQRNGVKRRRDQLNDASSRARFWRA
jgi:hypothetical protein